MMNSRKDYIFNTIAGLINASEAVIMSMVVTRVTSLSDAGYLAIAFAVGNLLMCIGKFGVYNFLVTDVNDVFHIKVYIHLRIITVILMLVSLIGYLWYGVSSLSYHIDKIKVILYINLIYVIEAMEDLLISLCQKHGKLYYGSLMFISRWIAILLCFSISIILSHSVSFGCETAFVASLLVFGVNLGIFFKRVPIEETTVFPKQEHRLSKSYIRNVNSLMISVLPLFLSNFLSFYLSNVSKYALEKHFTAEIQACYSFVSMPVFAIGLFNSFIYHPQLLSLTEDYRNNRIDSFRKRMYGQYIIILIVTVICVGITAIFGIPVLSWLYHARLNDYSFELIILMIAGGVLGLSSYQSVILTIERRQRYIVYGYIPVAILAMVITSPIVQKYSTIGAAVLYLASIVLLCVFYEVFLRMGKSAKNYSGKGAI